MNPIEWILDLFAGLFKDSRDSEERDEENDELDAARQTDKQRGIERAENKQLRKIVAMLNIIESDVIYRKIGFRIPIGNEQLDIYHAIRVLTHHLEELIKTKEPIKEEEDRVDSIVDSWKITKKGLEMLVEEGALDAVVEEEIERIDVLLEDIEIELREEEEIVARKVRDIKAAYHEIIQEEYGQQQQGQMPRAT